MRGRHLLPQQVPYMLIFAIMPGLVIKLTICTETEAFLDKNCLKKCLYQRERHNFVEALRRLLSFVLLFRDSDDNIEAKIKALKVVSDTNIKSGSFRGSSLNVLSSGPTKYVFIERRSAEEEEKMLHRCAPAVCAPASTCHVACRMWQAAYRMPHAACRAGECCHAGLLACCLRCRSM